MTTNTKRLVVSAVVGALYAAITLGSGFLSFGPIQLRVAEALCILPFFFPSTLPGLFVGCVIANLLSPYGLLDVISGSMATLLAVTCTMLIGQIYMRRKETGRGIFLKALACLPPVVFNAVIVGALIAYFETGGGDAFFPAMLIFGLQVGFGELVVMYALGLPFLIYLPGTRLYRALEKASGSLQDSRKRI